VYCKAACGNNVHKDCMDSWMRARQGKATCPYCRSIWAENDFAGKKVNLEGASRTEEGYINVASQLGISGERGECRLLLFVECLLIGGADWSTYHQPWVRQRQGYRYRDRW
jgi:hypothetical protein